MHGVISEDAGIRGSSLPARAEQAPGVRRPHPVRLFLRPFGYLLMAVIWSALTLAFLIVGPGLLAVGALEPLELAPVWERLGSDGSELLAFSLTMPVLAFIWGAAVLWMLPAASGALAGLAWIHTLRSLRPRYFGDALSYTTWVKAGETFGVTATSVALSLQPVHRSRVTDVLMRWYAVGWTPRWPELGWAVPAGAAYILVFIAMAADTPAVLRTLFVVVALALVAVTVVAERRQWLRRFDPDHQPRVIGGGRTVRELSPAARRRRIEKLRRARERRRQTPGDERR